MMNGVEILLALALKYENDWDKMWKSLKEKETLTKEDEERAKTFGGKYTTFISDDYPKDLKSTYKPPFVIFFDRSNPLYNANQYILR